MWTACSGFSPAKERSDIDTNALSRECAVFCRYLIGKKPGAYVLGKYADGHRVGRMARAARPDPFDAFLILLARVCPLAARLVDGYTLLFYRSSSVRRKLVLLLAILESCTPTYHYLDSVESDPGPLLVLRLLRRILVFPLVLFLGTLVILPVHVAAGVAGRLMAR
jgi:hypothetical protein